MKKALFAVIAIFCAVSLSLLNTSCHFSAQDDLIEYLENGGVRTNSTGDTTSTRQLSPVKAYIKYTDSELLIKDGDVFEESPLPMIFRAPTSTVAGNLRNIKDALILYNIQYCAPGATQFETVQKETSGIENSVDYELKTGYYIIEAFARKTGFIDSQAAVWNIAVGREVIITMKIVCNGYLFEYSLVTPLFSRANYDNYHNIILNVKMYNYDSANDTKTLLEELPSDVNAPLVYLVDKDTNYKLQEASETSTSNAYNFVLPEQLKGEGSEPAVYGLKIQMTYNETTVSDTIANAIKIVE